jgi:hypothetical protein
MRIEMGQSESEARRELYDLQARDYQPPLADDPSVAVDTTQPISQQLREVYTELGHLLFDSELSIDGLPRHGDD